MKMLVEPLAWTGAAARRTPPLGGNTWHDSTSNKQIPNLLGGQAKVTPGALVNDKSRGIAANTFMGCENAKSKIKASKPRRAAGRQLELNE